MKPTNLFFTFDHLLFSYEKFDDLLLFSNNDNFDKTITGKVWDLGLSCEGLCGLESKEVPGVAAGPVVVCGRDGGR